MSEPIRVWISDSNHPHHGERGVLTGEIISVLGEPMAKVDLVDCKHGTGGCFVSKGQVTVDRRD